MGPVGHVGFVCRVGSSGCVASFRHVGSFGRVEPCDYVSTSRTSSRVGPFGCVGSCGYVGSFCRVVLCGYVSTLGSFGLVGPVGRMGPSSRVGLSGHVGQFGRVESSGLVGLFGPVLTLKGWFGFLAACVRNSLSRLHGRFPVLISSLNQYKFPFV